MYLFIDQFILDCYHRAMKRTQRFFALAVLASLSACGGDAGDGRADEPVTTSTLNEQPGTASTTAAFSRLPPGSRVRDLAEFAKMQRFEALSNDPRIVRRSIEIDADVFDCVDMHLQHGFDQRIELLSEPPAGDSRVLPDARETMATLPDATKRCEEGTIPRRRITLNEMARFETLEDLFAKVPSHRKGEEVPSVGPRDHHQHAVYRQNTVANGAEAVLNLWSPSTELASEFSVSQLWVAGAVNAWETLQTVEAGWHVYPERYGDSRARIFVYFTPDNYAQGGAGCYNTDCAAFVQVSSSIPLGGAYSSYSTPNGPQMISSYRLQQNATGDWWVQIQGVWVGYWPRSRFASPGLYNGGDQITFGGEIVDNRPGGRHTGTDMGSGAFPSAGFGLAAYQRSMLLYRGMSAPYTLEVNGFTMATGSNCYDITSSTASNWGRYAFFGGPGYHPTNCY